MSLDDGRPTPDAATAADLARVEAKIDALADRLASAGSRWLSLADAAVYASISEPSLRRLLSARKLTPHRPLAGKILVDRRELDALILSSTRRPTAGRGRRRVAAAHGNAQG
jgi:hypothetical protein